MYQDKSSLFSDISSFFIFPVLQQISRLAVEHLTDGFEGGEADGLCLARLQDGKVGGSDVNLLRQLAQRNFPAGHHNIQIHYNRHRQGN